MDDGFGFLADGSLRIPDPDAFPPPARCGSSCPPRQVCAPSPTRYRYSHPVDETHCSHCDMGWPCDGACGGRCSRTQESVRMGAWDWMPALAVSSEDGPETQGPVGDPELRLVFKPAKPPIVYGGTGRGSSSWQWRTLPDSNTLEFFDIQITLPRACSVSFGPTCIGTYMHEVAHVLMNAICAKSCIDNGGDVVGCLKKRSDLFADHNEPGEEIARGIEQMVTEAMQWLGL